MEIVNEWQRQHHPKGFKQTATSVRFVSTTVQPMGGIKSINRED